MSESTLPLRVRDLLARGVRMPNPASVEIDPAIVPERIAPDAVIHAGCRLRGASTSVGPGSVLGAETPLTIEDSQLGANVELKGGYVAGSVFLDGANVGSGAHIRAGTLLEEEANGAHTVGLKQTILLPFVTLGSLINFCDVLMAGGTSRKNHSEVGSSFIHFNYTPHQDKATPSLLGDVPRGVFLDRAPIFLGGQGGLVGPLRLGFGCVTPAGSVLRRDAADDGMLVGPAVAAAGIRRYDASTYRGAQRVWQNNLTYIGNLVALREWYRHVRSLFMTGVYERFCLDGALRLLDGALKERLKRLDEWVAKLKGSAERLRADGESRHLAECEAQERIVHGWTAARMRVANPMLGEVERERFVQELIAARAGRDYLPLLPALPEAVKQTGRAWLQSLVESTLRAGEE